MFGHAIRKLLNQLTEVIRITNDHQQTKDLLGFHCFFLIVEYINTDENISFRQKQKACHG